MGFTSSRFKSVPGARMMIPAQMSGRPTASFMWNEQQIVDIAIAGANAATNCLSFRATAVAEPPFGLIVGDKGGKGGTYDPNHPISKLFSNPTPFHNGNFFFKRLVYGLDTSRKGVFVVAPLDRAGRPLVLWVKGPADVRIIPDSDTYIGRFELRESNTWKAVDPTESMVIPFSYPSPDLTEEFESWTPLAKAGKAVRSIRHLGEFVDSVLQSKAVLDGFITDESAFDQDMADYNRKVINERFNGPNNAGGIQYLPGGATFTNIAAKLSDVNPGEIEDRIETRICGGFEINPVTARIHAGMSMTEGLGGDKIAELKRQDYETTISQLWVQIAAALSPIAEAFGLTVKDIGFDLRDLPALRETEDALWDRMRRANWLSDNEKREQTGFDMRTGDKYADMLPQVEMLRRLDILSAGTLATQSGATSGAGGKSLYGVKSATFEAKIKAAVSADALASTHESAMRTAAKSCFESERMAVDTALARHKTLHTRIQTKDSESEVLSSALDAIDPNAWKAGTEPLIHSAMQDGGKLSADALDHVFDATKARVVSAAASRANKLAGNVTDTTKAKVRDFVSQGVEDGKTISEIAHGLVSDEGPWGEDATTSRCDAIARTETMGSVNAGGFEGANQAADELGLTVVKEWVTAGDDHVRESHTEYEAEGAVPIDEDYGGMQFPGDEAGDADDVINCRCTLAYSAESDPSQE